MFGGRHKASVAPELPYPALHASHAGVWIADAEGCSAISRGEAIRRAVAALQPGDVLLVAGKGHESGQIVGDRILPFSDHEAVAAALKEKVA